MTLKPDWDALRAEATRMTTMSYAPYSHVLVGAAALVDDGRIVAGCNVENASYGLSLCAECSLTSMLAGTGGGKLLALAVVGADGEYMAPCGRCRQILMEHGGPELWVLTATGVVTLDHLLPEAFGPHEVFAPRRADPASPAPREPPDPNPGPQR